MACGSTTNAISGIDGYVMAGACGAAAVVAEMNHWTVTITSDPIDVRVFGSSGWGAYKKGPKDWTASFDGFWYLGDTTGQLALHNALVNGTVIECYFHLDNDNYYYGAGLVTSEATDEAVDGVASISFDIQGDGAINIQTG